MTHLHRPVRVCLVPQLSGLGGPSGFQRKLIDGLARRGVEVCFDLRDPGCTVVLVNGGTQRLLDLHRLRRGGVRIVQRLDGINWLHRKRRTGVRHFLRAEYRNLLLANIRRHLAQQIVYQSQFARMWWEQVFGTLNTPSKVVHNGLDLERYSPQGPERPPADRLRLLLVEGHLRGGYDVGLENAVALVEHLDREQQPAVELWVVGDVPASLQSQVQARSSARITWLGVQPPEHIPGIDRSAHLLFSADLNPACPNAVIEALACGLPVVAFNTGALPELVQAGAGQLAPYGGDPWNLDPPDIPALAQAAVQVLTGQDHYRPAARRRAEAAFGLDQMVAGYLEAFTA